MAVQKFFIIILTDSVKRALLLVILPRKEGWEMLVLIEAIANLHKGHPTYYVIQKTLLGILLM